MTDRKYNSSTIAAWGLGLLSLALLAAGTVLGVDALCDWGVAVSAAAATAVVRSFFLQQELAIRNAYRIGQDQQQVSPLKSHR